MKRIKYLTGTAFLLLFFIFSSGYTQIAQPATPPSFLQPHLATAIPAIKMESLDVEKLLQEDLIFDTIKDIPWRFGKNLSVNINPDNAGTWDYLDNGDKIWRVSVFSPGAYTINLTFNQYLLPPGAKLFVYNENKSMIVGAFTDFNNQDDGYFATTLVEGDQITIEYFEPSDALFAGELNLATVTHAYRDPYEYARAFGSSGWCNLNVVCPEAEGWEKQIRSVAMIVVGGSGFCTGALINNTEFDGRPFFLSANHCYSNPGSIVLWFNWQSNTCSNPPSSPPYNSMSGAMQRARNAASDFWLMELNQPVPDDFNPVFAGWNRSLAATINEKIVGIHHPRGDIKKFSFANNGVQAASYGGGPGSGSTHWRIVWSGGTTTEPASSGSPIFDADGLILGQLHGGGAACGNTLPDWYGRFGVSWTGGGSPANSLRNWLDPLDLNLMTLAGFDPLDPGVENPANFVATATSSRQILLEWNLNEEELPVMIAVSPTNDFGKPEGPYTLGNVIDNGGKVIYIGNEQHFLHRDLETNTPYFYSIWSYNDQLTYSPGLKSETQTPCEPTADLPLLEGFNEEELPDCWEQVIVSGETNWQIGVGNGDGYPFNTFEGTSNVFFRITSIANVGNTTRLVTPTLDISAWQNAELSFHYANPAFQGNQDVLRVFVQPHEDADWTLLETFDINQFNWDHALISLPDFSETTRIAFEGEANRGRGISLDKVEVLVYFDDDMPVATDLTVSLSNLNQPVLEWTTTTGELKNGIALAGFNIFRNSQLITTLDDPLQETFTDMALPVGEYTYAVQASLSNNLATKLSDEASVTIEAFGNEYDLAITVVGEGKTMLMPGNYLYLPGSNVSVTAEASENWTFSHWNLNGVQNDASPEIAFNMDQNTALEAVFTIQEYTIQLLAEPAEAAATLEGEGIFSHGQVASFSTLPAVGFVFTHWKKDNTIVSTNPEMNFPIVTDGTFTAVFTERSFMVQLAVEPEQAGSVSGGGTFGIGASITVNAQTNPGWEFSHWLQIIEEDEEIISDDPAHSFTLLQDVLLTAFFEPLAHTLTVETQGAGSTVPTAGEHTFSFGHQLALSATPDQGWEFVKWVIDDVDILNPDHELIMDSDRMAKAVFEEVETTGIFHISDHSLLVFPVPASENINIRLPADSRWNISVLNLTGQVVKTHSETAGQTTTLNIEDLPSGAYVIRLAGNNQVIYGKFLVE